MIKYSNDWNKVFSTNIKNSCFTLDEFIKMIRKQIPEEIKNENILIDFNVEDYDEYNLYGENITTISSELEISIRKKED